MVAVIVAEFFQSTAKRFRFSKSALIVPPRSSDSIAKGSERTSCAGPSQSQAENSHWDHALAQTAVNVGVEGSEDIGHRLAAWLERCVRS